MKVNEYEMVSNCCGALRWIGETDMCSECKEHAEFIREEYEDEAR